VVSVLQALCVTAAIGALVYVALHLLGRVW
jgi:hypothetical protein